MKQSTCKGSLTGTELPSPCLSLKLQQLQGRRLGVLGNFREGREDSDAYGSVGQRYPSLVISKQK